MSLSPQIQRESESKTQTRRYRTIIFNNDFTPMDVVVMALMRATNCDAEEAAIEMWEAHHFGQANVHFSTRTECEEAANIIASVGVKTEVKPEWDDE